jgi:serine protease Do
LTVRNLKEAEYTKYKVDNGVMISKVKRFSKAENQRLFPGLIITEIDRIKIDSVSELEDIIDDNKGKAVLLKVVDEGGTSRFVGMEIPE